MRFPMVVVESCNGGWGYCPAAAREILGRIMEYDDEAPFKTAEEAIAAAKADPTVPKNAKYRVVPGLWFRNHYRHCGQEWNDEWSCMCNDKCPVCDAEIEPFKSDDLREEEYDHD
jgi:hypothetical protein